MRGLPIWHPYGPDCEDAHVAFTDPPSPTDRGLASADPIGLAERTFGAWADFRASIDAVDIDATTRWKKRRARSVIAKVGDWPESRQLPQILADARAGKLERIDQDAIDDAVVAAHEDDSRDDLLEAIDRSRDSVSNWIDDKGPAGIGLIPVGSPLGELPVSTYLHAAAFQLAIASRDLVPAGSVESDRLILAGLRALVDTTGALAARMGIDTTFAVVTPIGSVVTVAGNGGWTVTDIDAAHLDDQLPGLSGDAATLLDVAAGRRNPVTAIRGPEISINQMKQLMRLAPIAQENPGLPGGPVLRKAAGILGRFAR